MAFKGKDQTIQEGYIMDWKQKAERWIQFEGLDKVVREQLDNIKDR